MSREIVIGLEIHLKIASASKLFCACANEQDFDNLAPNTHICPVCTGQPGALPVLQKEPLQLAVLLGLALGCDVQHYSSFDRKSYFYPDLPMGYQITQQHAPTNIDGSVTFFVDKAFTTTKKITIRDAHIETDTGKTTQVPGGATLDYNRAGTPLVEIVTQPDFRSGDEVVNFLQELQRIAKRQHISSAEMEKGQMRCDVNISLRPAGEEVYRTRVEMKNMSSFSAVRRAIDHEVTRQQAVYTAGEEVAQETRGRDDASSTSYVMRSKEDAMDYRYMPEADLPALELQASWIETQRALLVPLPSTRIQEYTQTYGFNKEFINGLINDPEVNTYFHRCVDAGADPKIAANRLVGSVARWCNEKETSLTHVAFSFEQYVDFVQRQQDGSLLSNHAKIVIKEMLTSGKDPATIIEEKNLKPLDPAQVGKWIDELFAQQPDLLTDLQAGTMKPLGFITGQIMKKSGGSADPQLVQQLVRERV